MKKLLTYGGLASLIFILSGCNAIDNKTASLSSVYIITSAIALLVLLGYCFMAKKREIWYLLLFSSVLIVNAGYAWLSVSSTLGTALIANRVAYLGSVFLPFSMFMITLDTARIKYSRLVVATLLGISGIIFLIAASPGYLDIYYKEVHLSTVDGVSTLVKVYGPLHFIYLVYLGGYFSAMVYAIIYAGRKKSAENKIYMVILAMAVFINIGLWFMEKFINFDFEVLSVSYVISELFLLGLNMLMSEHRTPSVPEADAPSPPPTTRKIEVSEETLQMYKLGLENLTKTERYVYDAYVDGKSTKEVMTMLNIKENTLKFHNKNIYSKLGVSSRKQLVEIAKII